MTTRHPARYSPQLLPHFARLLEGKMRVLDPMSGTGVRLLDICPHACLNEIQYRWANQTPRGVVGNALHLPYPTGYFETVITSPAYGNRMGDNFTDKKPDKKYRRNTYTHAYGAKLHPDNAGQMQWGERYRQFHVQAWDEVRRVLEPGGTFVLNISDHIRAGERVYVSTWHVGGLLKQGFECLEALEVETPRNRQGKNYEARVACEYIFVFRKPEKPNDHT